ncbi:GNAT family N-acetyltransferase [Salsuginibacillus kocurii]|uniref:GNAT family N-acetyltransferase n=1 Tax=Salsuginibacillus kocurii TaxID=427078 RepID=UPI00037EB1FD|nr:GNAT family N-acetyltransferase [Salsuginibacillus kocurii]
MVIREATENDTNIIQQITREAFWEARHLKPVTGALKEKEEEIFQFLKEEHQAAFLGTDHHEPVAALRCTLKENELYLSRLAVRPAARGLGWGNALLLHAEAKARAHRKSFMSLKVRKDEEKHVPRYQHLGYDITAERTITRFDGGKIAIFEMHKTLPVGDS